MIRIKEWARADAVRAQKRVDEVNLPDEQAWRRRVAAAVAEGEEPPEPPALKEGAAVPQFHMSGERIFEVKAEGEGRAEIVRAINDHIRTHPRPPAPMPDRSADAAW